MATSGSVDFTINRNEIIESAYQVIGKLAEGETMSSDMVSVGSRWLNLIVKQWQGTSDFAPGLKTWSRKRGYVFLQTGQREYDLGPSGDHATLSYTRTTISANEAAAQTVLSITSSTGMTAADQIGVVMNNGAIHWSTISSTGAGPTVTIASGLSAAADAGNYVYFYTTKLRRPIKILNAVMRDENSKDSGMSEMDFFTNENLPDKTADGEPTSWFYEEQLTNGVLYFDTEPTDVTKVVRITFLSNIEDFDSATDTPDYPQEWNLALVMELAKYLAPISGMEFSQTMEMNRVESIRTAKNLYPENSDAYFQVGGL